MIKLSSTTALMLYLGFTLIAILAVWIYGHYTTRKKPILPLEKNLNLCEFCHFAYLDTLGKEVTRCPRCHSLNNPKQ
jgi:uncharacterized paraquat-inducible protein A